MAAAMLLMMPAACSRTLYVPVERHVRDTVINRVTRIDTVQDRDSVYIGLHGDTVVREVYRWRSRVRLRVDTVHHVRVDSVPVTVTAPHDGGPKASGGKKSTFERLLQAIVWCTRIIFAIIIISLVGPFAKRLFSPRKS